MQIKKRITGLSLCHQISDWARKKAGEIPALLQNEIVSGD